jgi:hypothetical protein
MHKHAYCSYQCFTSHYLVANICYVIGMSTANQPVGTFLQILHVYWAIRQKVLRALITYINEGHAIDNYNYHFLKKVSCFALRLLTLISLLFENSSNAESRTITNRNNVLIAISTFLLQGLKLLTPKK